MFGELVTAYLFLAGVGAGGVAAASLADLLFVREPFGADVVPDFAEKCPAERLVAGVLALSCGALALGVGCLAADLGRIDRVLSLFLAPPVTLMNLGAWAVALLTVLAAALALVRFLYLPWADRRAVVVAEVVACGLAVVVAVYAGLLLQTLSGVRLWSTPWVQALFALSAASCGCALLMAGALFVEATGAFGGRRAVPPASMWSSSWRRRWRPRGFSPSRWEAIIRVCEPRRRASCTARRRCPGGRLSWPAALRRRSPWKSAALFAGTGARARLRRRSRRRIPLRPWLLRLPSCSWVLWACAPRWWRPVPSVPWSCRKRKPPLPYLPKTRRRRACVPRLPQRKAGEKAPQRKERM